MRRLFERDCRHARCDSHRRGGCGRSQTSVTSSQSGASPGGAQQSTSSATIPPTERGTADYPALRSTATG
jgi:hypothetical protein